MAAERDTVAARELPGGVVVIGAGPAGLTAAYELRKAGVPVAILEQDAHKVGGLSRTVEYKGFRFDIGGHRFFSKNPLIEQLWTEIAGERMLTRDRKSRIFYRGVLFKYPLEIIDSLKNLGPLESAACVGSYVRARLARKREIRTFEDWVTHAFGRRLYEIFFKTYTEKVWGIPCDAISADWAAQRIRGLSLSAVIRAALKVPGRNDQPVIKTLIGRFRYPRLGPGEVWETLAEKLETMGAEIRMGERVEALERSGNRIRAVIAGSGKGTERHAGDFFVSTMPMRELILEMDPPAPSEVACAAANLRYRDFITVALILDREEVFPDQWIYIHDPEVRVGRIQNFKNWSPEMVSDARFTVLGLEYFCFDSSSMWRESDERLLAMAKRELVHLGLAEESSIVDGAVVRQPAAYPIYDGAYQRNVETIRMFLEKEAVNLQVAGRNGMHKYNNQDHAMLTGLMAARNILGSRYDQWRVNSDALYLEEGAEDTGLRLTPISVVADEIPPPRAG
jgi:protoporphyrinogen oxidase